MRGRIDRWRDRGDGRDVRQGRVRPGGVLRGRGASQRDTPPGDPRRGCADRAALVRRAQQRVFVGAQVRGEVGTDVGRPRALSARGAPRTRPPGTHPHLRRCVATADQKRFVEGHGAYYWRGVAGQPPSCAAGLAGGRGGPCARGLDPAPGYATTLVLIHWQPSHVLIPSNYHHPCPRCSYCTTLMFCVFLLCFSVPMAAVCRQPPTARAAAHLQLRRGHGAGVRGGQGRSRDATAGGCGRGPTHASGSPGGTCLF